MCIVSYCKKLHNLEIDNKKVNEIFSKYESSILEFTRTIVKYPLYTRYESLVETYVSKNLSEFTSELSKLIEDEIIGNFQKFLDYLDTVICESCLIYSLRNRIIPFHNLAILCDYNVLDNISFLLENEDKYLTSFTNKVIDLLVDFIQKETSFSYNGEDLKVYKNGMIASTFKNTLKMEIRDNVYRKLVEKCSKLKKVKKLNAKFNDTLYILREYTLEKIKEIISSEAYNLYREI